MVLRIQAVTSADLVRAAHFQIIRLSFCPGVRCYDSRQYLRTGLGANPQNYPVILEELAVHAVVGRFLSYSYVLVLAILIRAMPSRALTQ